MTLAPASLLAVATGPHLFWITSRAAGIAALLLASISVCVGVLMGGRVGRAHRAELRVAHEALSLATLAALVVHGLTLLGDGYLHPSLGELAIPLVSGYETLWTSIGIVAFWALACSACPTTRAPASVCSAGASCTALPRSPGCSG